MPGNEITKDELNAFTAAHEKTATVLEKIAGQLEQIVTKIDKVADKLDNGITDVIIDGVTKNYNQVHKETIDSLNRIENATVIVVEKVPEKVKEIISNSEISKDIQHVKWFVGIVGIVTIIALVIIRGMDSHMVVSAERAQLSELSQKLDAHMLEVKQSGILNK
jgi:Na+/phosphate symporter